MKNIHDPMSIEDIELLLQKAAEITNHRNFVIVGSLSGLGSLIRPPDEMVMSRDVDFYTKNDPGRIFSEVADHLSENSEFGVMHGFYGDPVSPNVLSAPEGWSNRLVPITFKGGIVGWFMDANDAACAKMIRGEANDRRWVKAGIEAGAISEPIIRARMKTCENVLDGEVEQALACLDEILEGRSSRPPRP